MKKVLFTLSLACFFVLLFSCGGQTESEQKMPVITEIESNENADSLQSVFKKFEWLIGEWSNEAKGQLIGEYWTKVNDSLLEGIGFGLKGQDTVFKESLTIVILDGEIYYVPTVSGQNDNQPVLFKVTDVRENYFMSENKNHDFPQIIRYQLEAEGVLLAVIEGKMNGEETKREFRFRRATVRLMP